MMKSIGWVCALTAALLMGLTAIPIPASAQSPEELGKKIHALEQKLKAFGDLKKQIQELKKQIKSVQKEQKVQKAKVVKREKDLASLDNMKKTFALLSKLKISGGATGIIQATEDINRRLGGDEAFAGGSFDILFTHKPMKNVTLLLDLEAIAGNGPDSRFPTLSGLNDDVGTTNDTVTVLEAWVEATFLNDRLTLTAGKIDMTNYVDGNNLAADETSQFLSSAFVNNAVLSFPGNATGLRARYDIGRVGPIPGSFYLEAGVVDQDADTPNGLQTDKLFNKVYAVAEIGYNVKFFGREGNYRIWGFADGNGREITQRGAARQYTALGGGISIDQVLTDHMSAFFRLGYRDSGNLNYTTQSAWSAGLQFAKLVPQRPDDVFGFAFGEIRPTKRSVVEPAKREEEALFEAYYRWHFTDAFHLSPLFQFVANRNGNDKADDFVVFGARLQVNF